MTNIVIVLHYKGSYCRRGLKANLVWLVVFIIGQSNLYGKPGRCCQKSPQVKPKVNLHSKGLIFAYYKEHPESAEHFNEFMSFFSDGELRGILNDFDWSVFNGKQICDIGGCYGVVMKAVKEKFPDITTINFDLPEVIEKAESIPGVQIVAGDMFDSSTIPSCNVVFMKHILHNWDDEDCIKIIKSLHKALPSDGKVVICDAILPKSGVTNPIAKSQKALDMLMAIIGGRERNQDQWRAIFEASGLKIDSVLPMTSGGPLTGIIATSKV
ncbi:uncharacterized protein [Clytia hemisphaerica]|uniref:Acetylserotonin O-methyltransferase n=1 Tax=Clytia hemisphaerica TaxID=252671 RepID=A0A7M6DKF5_9CNID